MEKITKEKNIYTFVLAPLKTSGQERVYQLDLNTGVFINANTGRQLIGNPAGMKKILEKYSKDNCVIRYLYYSVHFDGISIGKLNPDELMMYDKFDAINLSSQKLFGISFDKHKILLKHLGEVAKFILETEDNYNLQLYAQNLIIKDFIKKYNIILNDYFTERDCQWFIDLERTLLQRQINPISYINPLIYHYQKVSQVFKSMEREYLILDLLQKMVFYANALEVNIPKGDTLRIYSELYKNYEMNKAQIDNKTLAQWNYLSNLTFENENFQVIIPKTVEEFQQEGDSQHNCVYTMYLKKVINKQTRVVFIRRKNDLSQSYITCEVSNDGVIRQYLEKYNTRPTDTNALQFKQEYQDYLRELWVKGF